MPVSLTGPFTESTGASGKRARGRLIRPGLPKPGQRAMMEFLLKDVRYGYRTLLNNPGFAAIAVLSLALGIGANTAIFSFIDTVLLRSLPVREPDKLVSFGEGHSQGI